MNKIQNFAHLFSFWIFLWFFLYYFGYFKDYNPKLALTVGMAIEIFMIILMFFNGVSIRYIFIFFLLQVFIKVIPLYIIRNKPSIDPIPDLKSTIIVFFIYLAFLYWNDVDVIDFNTKAFYNFTHGVPNSLFMQLLDDIIYK